MTKIAITPNVSGTGTFTLTAPDSNTDRTLTLPDAAGTVFLSDASNTIQPSNISDGTTSVGTEYVVNGSAKSRLHYNHSTTTVNSSLNISSVTDVATGQLTENYTNAFTGGGDKSVVALSVASGTAALFTTGPVDFATSSSDFQTYNSAGTILDSNRFCSAAPGDLA